LTFWSYIRITTVIHSMTKGSSNKVILSKSDAKDELWRQLVDENLDFAWQVARRFLTGHEDIQDAIQAAFVKAWKSFQQYDSEKSLFSTWFFTILKNTCIDLQRQNMKRFLRNKEVPEEQVAQNPAESLSDQLDNEEIYRHILVMADDLPLMQKECFMLRDVQGYSMKEIAGKTGQTEGSIKTSVYLARKKLRQWIEEKQLL